MAVALDDQLARRGVQARVELWVLRQGQRGRLEQKAREGQRDAALLGRLEAPRHHGVEIGDVGLVEVRHVRDERRGQRHPLRDGAAEMRERLALDAPPLLEVGKGRRLEPDAGQRLGGAGRHRRRLGESGSGLADRAADVIIRDAPTRAGAAHGGEIHAQLARETTCRGGGGGGSAFQAGRGLGFDRRRRGCGRRRCRAGRGGAVSTIGEGHQHLPHLDGLARLHVNLLDAAPERRRDLDLGLVGLHFQERGVLLHDVPLANEDGADLGFDEAFTEIGESEAPGHGVS